MENTKANFGQVDEMLNILGIKKPSKFETGLGVFGNAMQGLGESSSLFRGDFDQAEKFRGLNQPTRADEYQKTKQSLLMKMLFPDKGDVPTSIEEWQYGQKDPSFKDYLMMRDKKMGPAGDPYAPYIIPILEMMMGRMGGGGKNPYATPGINPNPTASPATQPSQTPPAPSGFGWGKGP